MLTGVGLISSSALIRALLLPTTALYLSSVELAIWCVLFDAALFLVSGILIDALEATDLIWNRPLQRPFSAASTRDRAHKPLKVSIHVTIHNEPPEVVRRTLNALANLDYPD